MSNILITGGAGFIGHHFVDYLLHNTTDKIIIIDNFNYAGNFKRLRDIGAFPNERVLVLTSDISVPFGENLIPELKDVEYILHLAAETHVNRSIENAYPFIKSNVVGTFRMLELARQLPLLKCFYYFGTDEVFGPADVGVTYRENNVHNPKNPYAATKSAGEMLVKSYGNTHGIPYIITRTTNVIGERQHPEKFLPLIIKKIIHSENLIIHTDNNLKTGSRVYIHPRQVVDAYCKLMASGSLNDEYHIVGDQEITNLSMANFVANHLNLPLFFKLERIDSCRPGHDLRYSISGEKMEKLGWRPSVSIMDSLPHIIDWYIENPSWLV